MKDSLGKYRCDDCSTAFKIADTNVVKVHENWQPTCPTCGTQNAIRKVGDLATA